MAISDDPRRLRTPLFAFVVTSLAASACSPEAAATPDANRQHAYAARAPASAPETPRAQAERPRTSGEMQREGLAREGGPRSSSAASITDRRCGWLSNPTPGNWWLFDGHGEWILATQG